MLKLKPPIYGNKTLKLAFEFGLVLSETAKAKNIDLTTGISLRAEEIFIKELKVNGYKKTGLNFIPLIMAALEV